MQADNIIVLDQGEIVEQGTHLDLLQTGGAYDKLVNAQQLGSNKSIDKKEPSVTEEADSIKSTDGTVGEPLRRKLTSVKSYKSSSDDRSELKQRSLVKALSIFLRENLNLWPWYLIVFIGALIGGAYLRSRLRRTTLIRYSRWSLSSPIYNNLTLDYCF